MRELSRKYSILLAVISGVLIAFAFPTRFGKVMFPNLGFLAWFAFVPLFVAIYHASLRRTFLLSFLTAFIYHSVSLHWLYNALTEYGKMAPLISMGVLCLMMIILSTYVALAPTWTRWFRKRWGGSSIYLMPVAWIAMMLARNYFPAGGFPWNNVSYTQAGYPILIQTADLFGVYGLALFIIMVNQLLAEVIVGWGHARRIHLGVKAISAFIIFSLVLAYGWYRLDTISSRTPIDRIARISLIQGNIPQEDKWDEALLEKNVRVYKRYMSLIKESEVSLAVWPEAAYPYVIPLSQRAVNPDVLGLNPEKENGPWLLFGALSVDKANEKEPLYNSAILVDNFGDVRARYHKGHLVPFGEYVPYKKLFFFAKKLTAPVGEFLAGKGFHPIQVKDFKVGPLICYEDVFPEISREFVVNGANLLINMTNDAWYGWTSAAYQHLAISIFRAVENRRYVVRATNTGVTAVIDPKGIVELETRLFTRGIMATGISLLSGLTVYDRIGDLFAYICSLIVILGTGLVAGRSVFKRLKKD